MDDEYDDSSKMEGIIQRAGYEEPRHQGRNLEWSSHSESLEEEGINLSNSSGYRTSRNVNDLRVDIDLQGMDVEVNFDWPEDPPIGQPSGCHRAAIELLQSALQDSITASKTQMHSRAQEIRELKRMILLATAEDNKSKALFGRIECLAKEHGSLAHALETVVQVGHDAHEGLVTLSGHFDTFCDGLKDCMLKTTLTQDSLVKLMGWVQANEAKRSQALAACVSALKQMVSPLGTATAITPVVNVPVIRASGTIDTDTSFGNGHIGSMPMEITMNFLFNKIKDLEAKVHILQERVKNMGIIFHPRLHFPIGKIGNSYFTYYFFKKKIGTPYSWK
jgi:hypothetical protein